MWNINVNVNKPKERIIPEKNNNKKNIRKEYKIMMNV